MSVEGRGSGAGLLLPGAAGAAALGLAGDKAPLIAAGFGALTVLSLLPWIGLFLVLSLASIIQSTDLGPLAGVTIGGLTFRPAMLIVVPFLIRAYLLTRRDLRNRWGLAEVLLLGLLLLQPLSSYLHSPSFRRSLPTVGLVAFGVIAYLTVYASTCTRRRLISATRVFLGVIFLNAGVGLAALVAHFALGTHFGVSTRSDFGPGVFSLSFEHDIFASTCGVGAIAYYSLWRERNPVVSARWAGIGFWVCLIGTLLGLARAAWLGFGLAFIAMVILTRRGRRSTGRMERAALTLMLFVTVLLVGSFAWISAPSVDSPAHTSSVVGGIKAKAQALLNVNAGTGRARLNEFHTAVADLNASPVIGLGASTYNQRHPQKSKTNFIGNVWLRITYDSGLLGLLLFGGAVLMILWPDRILTRSKGEMAAIARALTFGWLSLAVAYAGTDDTLYMWPWILLALVRVARLMARRELRQRRAAQAVVQPSNGDLGAEGRVAVLGPWERPLSPAR